MGGGSSEVHELSFRGHRGHGILGKISSDNAKCKLNCHFRYNNGRLRQRGPMVRATRHYLQGYAWRITHRCHKEGVSAAVRERPPKMGAMAIGGKKSATGVR